MGVYDIASNTWSTMPMPLGLAVTAGRATSPRWATAVPRGWGTAFVSLNPATGDDYEPGGCSATCQPGTQRLSGVGRALACPTQREDLRPPGRRLHRHGGLRHRLEHVDDAVQPARWRRAGRRRSIRSPGTYYAYGAMGAQLVLLRHRVGHLVDADIPVPGINDGGMAYVGDAGAGRGSTPFEGETGAGFVRFVTPLPRSADRRQNGERQPSDGGRLVQLLDQGHQRRAGTIDDHHGDRPAAVRRDFVSSSTTSGTCTGSTTVTCSLGAG